MRKGQAIARKQCAACKRDIGINNFSRHVKHCDGFVPAHTWSKRPLYWSRLGIQGTDSRYLTCDRCGQPVTKNHFTIHIQNRCKRREYGERVNARDIPCPSCERSFTTKGYPQHARLCRTPATAILAALLSEQRGVGAVNRRMKYDGIRWSYPDRVSAWHRCRAQGCRMYVTASACDAHKKNAR